ncbi:NDP-glycosyltransferase YjiC-like [Oppia nitens]|uniref:NDP-glycosyltransferase YjiC-like n=1 Tax=Oppia nitens TaxID=1686743 RepID=UPI0023DC8447|nr:NDP-glycosyltransferase YjiC-like [Oppia nitens]
MGHINMCIGLVQQLAKRGHRLAVMATREHIEAFNINKYINDDNNVELVRLPEPGLLLGPSSLGTSDFWSETNLLNDSTPLYKQCTIIGHAMKCIFNAIDQDNLLIEKLIGSVDPDLIVTDYAYTYPAIEQSGRPIVKIWVPARLSGLNHNRLPPHGSGLPINSDIAMFDEFRQHFHNSIKQIWESYNQYMLTNNCRPLPSDMFFNIDNCLNIYAHPRELNQLYENIERLPKNVIRVDHMLRQCRVGEQQFEIPDKLIDKSGKLVYFSMGTLCSMNPKLFVRIIDILGKSRNRFIVAVCPELSDYNLPDNVWGQPGLPQLAILPLVDLVITHCGNNTICETMYFGKPMICLPVYSDQYDHSQRVHESGFGIRLDVHKCTERQLLGSIDSLLADKSIS